MTLGLSQISISKKRGTIKPKFLGTNDIPKINWLITRMSSFVGRKYSEIDFNELENMFLDWKVGRGLIKVLLNSYFSLEEMQMKDLVGYDLYVKLERLGITRPIDLRIEFFKFVQQKYDGIITRNKHSYALKEAAKLFGINDPDLLLELLYSDNIRNYRLSKRKEYLAEEIAGFYNFEVVMTLLYYATSLSVTLKSKNYGFIAKKVYMICKQHGVLVDFIIDSQEKLIIKMTGPKQLFGRHIKYGLAMSHALAQIFKLMKQVDLKAWNITAELEIKKKRYTLKINEHDLEYFNPLPTYSYSEWETFFDSDVEKRIYWIFKSTNPRGWQIEREPEPIMVENILVIPDFALRKDDKKILLEVVGYWRNEYIERKRQKYKILCNYGIPILLLIDKKLSNNFKDVPCEKVVYVRKSTGQIDISWNSFFNSLKKLKAISNEN